MNDITALMAAMKAAAEKAIEANERLCVMPPDEIFDVSLAHSKQLDADITLLNAHYDESTPANVKVLAEALEKAQRYIERLRQWNADLAQESCEYQNRIASLESRTVTVKLPELPVLGSNAEWYQGYAAGTSSMRKDCATALRAAGIQVIEGEGQ